MGKHKVKNKSFFILVQEHVIENINLYIIVATFFLIGIVAGVLFYNNLNGNAQETVNEYITGFIQDIKSGHEVDVNELLKQTVIKNVSYAVLLWFMGCTVIGLPVVYGMISLKGFTLGYTICSIIGVMGMNNGTIFCLSSLLLQNFIAIPTYMALAVSCNKLYKSIMKDKRRENIKLEIVKHTLFCLILLVALLISNLMETYISSTLLQVYIKAL